VRKLMFSLHCNVQLQVILRYLEESSELEVQIGTLRYILMIIDEALEEERGDCMIYAEYLKQLAF